LIDLCERDALLTNLSASGGFTPARLGVRKFSRIQVVFDLPELLGQSPQEVSAYVARESPAGTGLEWCEHSSLTIVRLLRFFSQATPVADAASPMRSAPPETVFRDRRTAIQARYSAQWVKRADNWLIRSEVFVP